MKITKPGKHNLLQTPEEWAMRNQVLANALGELIKKHIHHKTYRGLEVGCQRGILTDALAKQTGLSWWGIDPVLEHKQHTPNGAEILPGWAHQLPFPDAHFDCVIFANVYEHVLPEQRMASINEIRRVLIEGGVLIGQLPNPYFPIESHSRLPLMGWLPRKLQLLYWRWTTVEWDHDFYVVTIRDLKRKAEKLDFETVLIRNFNYPAEVIPRSLRWAAVLFEKPMRLIPWSWQFVFRKK